MWRWTFLGQPPPPPPGPSPPIILPPPLSTIHPHRTAACQVSLFSLITSLTHLSLYNSPTYCCSLVIVLVTSLCNFAIIKNKNHFPILIIRSQLPLLSSFFRVTSPQRQLIMCI
ncbi:hypothetical protein E2C01_085598 [Portunus trituberculatus]|uniref:Uncharacterized protein n=1 Tax=Portunus trituberculatus TaxID=210409 RepID=A0A5B7J809_PORTR|nr:hypothetical protein [Portunus trituberculatus]